MHWRGLVISALFLASCARRSIRIHDSHHDVQQEDTSLANGLEAAIEAREALIPRVMRSDILRGVRQQVGASREGSTQDGWPGGHLERYRDAPSRFRQAVSGPDEGPSPPKSPVEVMQGAMVVALAAGTLAAGAVQPFAANANGLSDLPPLNPEAAEVRLNRAERAVEAGAAELKPAEERFAAEDAKQANREAAAKAEKEKQAEREAAPRGKQAERVAAAKERKAAAQAKQAERDAAAKASKEKAAAEKAKAGAQKQGAEAKQAEAKQAEREAEAKAKQAEREAAAKGANEKDAEREATAKAKQAERDAAAKAAKEKAAAEKGKAAVEKEKAAAEKRVTNAKQAKAKQAEREAEAKAAEEKQADREATAKAKQVEREAAAKAAQEKQAEREAETKAKQAERQAVAKANPAAKVATEGREAERVVDANAAKVAAFSIAALAAASALKESELESPALKESELASRLSTAQSDLQSLRLKLADLVAEEQTAQAELERTDIFDFGKRVEFEDSIKALHEVQETVSKQIEDAVQAIKKAQKALVEQRDLAKKQEFQSFELTLSNLAAEEQAAQAELVRTSILNLGKRNELNGSIKALREVEETVSKQIEDAVQTVEKAQKALDLQRDLAKKQEELQSLELKLTNLVAQEQAAQAELVRTSRLNFLKKNQLKDRINALLKEQDAVSKRIDDFGEQVQAYGEPAVRAVAGGTAADKAAVEEAASEKEAGGTITLTPAQIQAYGEPAVRAVTGGTQLLRRKRVRKGS